MKFPIESILDNDLYNFTQQNVVFKLFPNVKVRYKFYNRGKTIFPAGFAEQLREQVQQMEALALTKEEKEFMKLKTEHYLDAAYLDFLEGYRYNPSEVGIIQIGGKLEVQISGYWYRTILWEVPLLSLISELYYNMTGQEFESESVVKEKSRKKAAILKLNDASFAEFGARRRCSFKNQLTVTKELKEYGGKCFIGTSNVYIAFLLNTTPIGTISHQFIMAIAAMFGYKSANSIALKLWKSVYKGYLGTMLPDTYTTDNFLRSFTKEYAELCSGTRQDSGDPIEYAKKFIAHYTKLGIDPLSKTIVFSNAINSMEMAIGIIDFCRGKIKASLGIGTFFSNDAGATPLNIVIKIDEVEIDGVIYKTVKVSDDRGKHTGDKRELTICLVTLNLFDQLKEGGYIDENGNVTISACEHNF